GFTTIGRAPVSSQLVVILDSHGTSLKILQRLAESVADRTGIKSFADPGSAWSFCAENRPDLVILGSIGEPGGAVAFLHRLAEQRGLATVPVLMVGAE